MADYRQSGVDIDAGNEVVRRIRQMAKATYTPGVLSGVGSFGGLFALDANELGALLLAVLLEPVGVHEARRVVVRVFPDRRE